jgi:dynein heavy chain
MAIKIASDMKFSPDMLRAKRASTSGSTDSGYEGRHRSSSVTSVGGLAVGPASGKERLFLVATLTTSIAGAAKAQAMAAVRRVHNLTSLTDNAKVDHALVGGVLKQMLGARMSTHDSMVFHNIMRDMWNFCSLHDYLPEQEKFYLIQEACTHQALQLGLIDHPPWMHKVMQLYTLLNYSPGVIVAGTCGSGKTSCIRTLASGLSAYSAGHVGCHTNKQALLYKTHHINPVATSSLSYIFGCIDSSGNWQEGILTLLLKKALKSQNVVTWLCFDGPSVADWTDCLTQVLDGNQMLTMGNGTQLMLNENVKIILETSDLQKMSPSVLSKTGILYLDDGILGWEPLFEAWLATRPEKERQDLGDLMTATLDQVIHFLKNNCSPPLMVCEAGVFQTCLALLSSLLNNYAETGEVFEKMHVKKLFLFSVVWSFGSLLQYPADRRHFSDFIKTLTECFPDDYSGLGPLTVFDFYVDESGEFEPWHMRLPERNYIEAGDMLGEVYVETPTTVCIALLMGLASSANRNILLVGPSGAGKTAAINQFLSRPDHKSKIIKKLAFCPCTTVNSLNEFFDDNMYHRQGLTYGPRDGKSMELFIEDLNLCETDAFGNQPANEFLRQVLDHQGYFCKCTCTIGQMKEVTDVTVIASVRTVAHINMPQLPEQLRRHFAIFCLLEPSRDSIQTVAFSVLEACMTQNDGISLSTDLHERLVKASCDILFLIQQNLQPCELPGREYYCFTQKELTKVFQGLQHCNEEMRPNRNLLLAVWQHEMSRVFLDKVCRSADNKWIEETIQIVSAKHFPRADNTKAQQMFVTFPLNVQPFQHRQSAMSHSGSNCTLLALPLNESLIIHASISEYRDRYCEEFGADSLNLTLSDLAIVHIVRLHRIMTFYKGDVLMIGRFGMDLQSLAKLSLYMSGFEALPTPVAASRTTAFFDLLRNSFRQAGLEGKGCSLLLTDTDVKDPVIMEAVNAFVVTGELPLLFTDDELQGLLQSLMPAIQRDFPSCDTDPMEYFSARVRRCLRIVLCLRSDHPFITSQAHLYHGLISELNVLWVKDWQQHTVANKADVVLRDTSVVQALDINTRKCLIECITAIHCQALGDSGHLPWVDSIYNQKPEIAAHHDSNAHKHKRITRTVTLSPSKTLLERIKHMECQRAGTQRQGLFVGPKMFERFLEAFKRIFTGKSRQSSKVMSQLRSALSTLDQISLHTENLSQTIKELNLKYATASAASSSLLTDLTNAACAVEKLKERLGKGSNFIAAFSSANELLLQEINDTEELEEDPLDAFVEEYDRQRERLLDAVQELEKNQIPLKKQLTDCQEQVIYWRNKMDRNTVERIRSLNSPPRLIGTIMELVITLIRHTQDHSVESDTAAADAVSDQTTSSPKPSSVHATRKVYSMSLLPAGGAMQSRLDRDQWTAIQLQIGDPQKFVEALQQVPWEEGLSKDLAGLIVTYLNPAHEYGGAASVTNEAVKPKSLPHHGSRGRFYMEQGSPLTGVSQKTNLHRGSSRASIPLGKQRKSSDSSSGITLAAAKHASEDAAVLLAYVVAILDYHHCYVPHKSNELKLVDLQKEMTKIEEASQRKQTAEISNEVEQKEEKQEPSFTEEDLPRLEQEMTDLQEKFEETVLVKYNIDQQRTKAQEMLQYGEAVLEK